MQLNVAFDTAPLDRTARNFEKNLAYSTAQAINAAVLEAQRRVRASLRKSFNVRRAAFLDRAVKVFVFASVGKNRAFAEVGIDNKPRLMLSLYESGGPRAPFKGKSVAVPITGRPARPNITSSVNPAFTFQGLQFKRGPITKRGREILGARRKKGIRKRKLSGQYYVWQGNQRTFILPRTARAPYGGVFQRVGPGRDDIRLIYSFRRAVMLRKALAFVEQTREAYEDVFRETFVRKFFRLGT